eukprot:3932181-Rhodomonas_salina.2
MLIQPHAAPSALRHPRPRAPYRPSPDSAVAGRATLFWGLLARALRDCESRHKQPDRLCQARGALCLLSQSRCAVRVRAEPEREACADGKVSGGCECDACRQRVQGSAGEQRARAVLARIMT